MKKIQLKKKINKLLDTKISIVSAFWLVLVMSIICIMLITHKKTYSYVDMNNSSGKSHECYYDGNSRDIRCMISVKVQQYYEVK